MGTGTFRRRHGRGALARVVIAAAVMGFLSGQSISRAQEPVPGAPVLPLSPTGSVAPAVDKTQKSYADQFTVVSTDGRTRSAFLRFARSVRSDLESVLGLPDTWYYPVEIRISGGLSDFARETHTRREIIMLPSGDFAFKVEVNLDAGFRRDELTGELLRLFLTELMLAKGKERLSVDTNALGPPEWLYCGLMELIEYQREGRPSDTFSTVLNSRQILSVDDVLSGPPEVADSITEAIYGASAAALVKALLEQPNGKASLQRYVGSLIGNEKKGRDQLAEFFPVARGNQAALDKWWTLQVATMGELQAFEFIPVDRTDRLIEDALSVQFEKIEESGEKEGNSFWKLPFLDQEKAPPFSEGTVRDYRLFVDQPAGKEALAKMRDRLRRVYNRAFPLLQPVIVRYDVVVGQLLDGKAKGVGEELAALDEERLRILNTMKRVDDYLNYYEATKVTQKSEAFEDYQQAVKRLRQPGPRRKDRISEYLDKLEREFSSR